MARRKEEQLQLMIDTGVVAVIRASASAELMSVIEALKKGGIRAIEVTMTTPGALDVIRETTERFGDEVLVGVGSVLDAETARMAMLAGAEFVVGPVLSLDVIRVCRRYDKIVIPGAFTPTEILAAWEAGADVVKVFPATRLGPSFFKDVLGPLPQVRLTPTGGVTVETAPEFIKAGAVFVGAGGALVDRKAVAQGRFDVVTETAERFISAIRAARESK
ncbi:MAG: bifunctional 4-hydroxy-2-oxoglutarate aldolase/2-dehydro-3-deoxy-phosphogluconate aldolase [Bacillota bacterium]|nr:bifunctional 4-hydroxy-2-oxoglutarate aldolase/2-dehydro-3-deoxy-phosphogluconate aldolase [Bacillota bacterium]HPZ54674.1 bifunctional 4-hydroxy-2-oxoglutarate aldolase/2-dehydro-3-deoxy-phosphogluconate aldolase [Bacillota bacterium]HQD19107.1 bifunctional 4-hydroxy-2-oxoglutarate aldolase/2-dehydro-3-deoxy-phosphogluconate aldolase [Bacillota bacterium]